MNRSADPGQAGPLKNAILIAGPTASGKSDLAMELARRTGGIVVNADSMQVYSVLSVLTARPTATDVAKVPHKLYGYVHPSEPYSTGRWMRDVAGLIGAGTFKNRTAVFVGGTGLYFRALTEGLSPMPDIPDEIRQKLRRRLVEEGPQALHALLSRKDPAAAEAIRPSDGQRILRALEVLEASGRPISAWQAERSQPLVDAGSSRLLALVPDRESLHRRIDERFDRMVAAGAVEEVRELLALRLDASMPAMKAIGVPEFRAYLDGKMTLEEAVSRAKAVTRQYAKRQVTWLRHQLGPEWHKVPPEDAKGLSDHG
ncbi:tRNA (adenosine(37)-N6)-dimethylallyltransferase MiaA [Mesorhizobium sp. J18]|uniref:tRNA (adenosine(37)-N6)-dimethylallyltransferase MiaA n=1 Tax=Mesorhizobium sp. J18 TaxID=935263 RepID=UPI0011A56DC6|nr:tRNA (adenosine(37)-N6)-dimethylallyltransferase MiaA [Mesorhizobium sp. J18]